MERGGAGCSPGSHVITDGFQREDTRLPSPAGSGYCVRPSGPAISGSESESCSLMEFIAALSAPSSDSALKEQVDCALRLGEKKTKGGGDPSVSQRRAATPLRSQVLLTGLGSACDWDRSRARMRKKMESDTVNTVNTPSQPEYSQPANILAQHV